MVFILKARGFTKLYSDIDNVIVLRYEWTMTTHLRRLLSPAPCKYYDSV